MRALIVEDGLSRQALAAARALAARGWEVGIGSPDRESSIATASRAVRAWHRVGPPGDGVEAFARDVEAAIAAGAYDLVFGSRDDEVAVLTSLRERLPAKVAHPELATFAAALDKVELARLAGEAGFAVPRTLPAAPGQPPPPGGWIVKPRVGRALVRALERDAALPARAQAEVAASEREVGAAIAAIEAVGEEAVVQERLDGELIALVILAARDHSIVRSYQQRAELCWPLDAGISVRAEVVPSDPALADAGAALVRALGWTGLAQIQLIAPRDSAPRVIDFNGRFFGSLALARGAGSNLADAWARGALTGTTPDPGPARIGARYHWAWGDVRRATQERRGGLTRDLAGVARYARGATHSVFSARDPRPAMRYLRVAGGQAGRRRTRRGTGSSG